jgi:hypothetical protein
MPNAIASATASVPQRWTVDPAVEFGASADTDQQRLPKYGGR